MPKWGEHLSQLSGAPLSPPASIPAPDWDRWPLSAGTLELGPPVGLLVEGTQVGEAQMCATAATSALALSPWVC